jgi:hypothetical protein
MASRRRLFSVFFTARPPKLAPSSPPSASAPGGSAFSPNSAEGDANWVHRDHFGSHGDDAGVVALAKDPQAERALGGLDGADPHSNGLGGSCATS